jgi:hypothetical protein
MDQSDLYSTTEEPAKSEPDEPFPMLVVLSIPLWYRVLEMIHRMI